MSTTVREALLNAQMNFETVQRLIGSHPIQRIAKAQLDNAMTAIENGMGLDDVIQESLNSEVKTKS